MSFRSPMLDVQLVKISRSSHRSHISHWSILHRLMVMNTGSPPWGWVGGAQTGRNTQRNESSNEIDISIFYFLTHIVSNTHAHNACLITMVDVSLSKTSIR